MVSASYAILDGRLHRQDVPGGDWTMLDDAAARVLLDRLSSPHLPTMTMVEAAAIALFDHDEDLNVAFVARCDAEGNRAPGDALGRERDRWENHDNELQAAFRRRALAALHAAFAAEARRLAEAEAAARDGQAAPDGVPGAVDENGNIVIQPPVSGPGEPGVPTNELPRMNVPPQGNAD